MSRSGSGRLASGVDFEAAGRAMHGLAAEMYPICRSITGDGFRKTLDILGRDLPLERHEVPSGTRVFDWTVPPEWNIRGASIKGPDGAVVADFERHNLHVVSYSVPFRGRIPRDELLRHLHSLPEHPDWIPYRTSYYDATWGFCVADRVKAALGEGLYEVHVDTTLRAGSLTYAEHVVRGTSEDEVLISCHGCHPSLANDNLSGLVVAQRLARLLTERETRLSYRFLVIPGTIGAITWLARNEARVGRVRHGLVLTCLGDRGPLTYKKSRRGNATIDRAVMHVLATTRDAHRVLEFDPYGYDERQYCSPGFDLPVGRLTRTPHGMFPEYHTSADDMQLITPESLADSLKALLEVLDVLEQDGCYENLNPKCEPQLGRRGVYGKLGGVPDPGPASRAMLWVLSLADERHSLLDIAERAHVPFATIREAASVLEQTGLLRPIGRERG
jgi:aminopeptidase-like protein